MFAAWFAKSMKKFDEGVNLAFGLPATLKQTEKQATFNKPLPNAAQPFSQLEQREPNRRPTHTLYK